MKEWGSERPWPGFCALVVRLGVQTQAGEIFIALWEAVVSPVLLIKSGLIVFLAREGDFLREPITPGQSVTEQRWRISD